MLGSHQEVATTWEPHLFDGYIQPWRDRWRRQVSRSGKNLRYPLFYGLPAVFTEEEFDELIRDVVAKIQRKTLSHKPSARILLEKCPDYSFEVDSIVRYVTDARFIHLIRDGREVADSLTRASCSWGAFWAPTTVEDAARMWREHVAEARKAADKGLPYLEVRYDMLKGASGPQILSEVFGFCHVEVSVDACRRILEQHDIRRTGTPQELASNLIQAGELAGRTDAVPPEGFVRRESDREWRQSWKMHDRLSFDRGADGLLVELGYAEADWTCATTLGRTMSSISSIRSKIRRNLGRIARGVGRRLFPPDR